MLKRHVRVVAHEPRGDDLRGEGRGDAVSDAVVRHRDDRVPPRAVIPGRSNLRRVGGERSLRGGLSSRVDRRDEREAHARGGIRGGHREGQVPRVRGHGDGARDERDADGGDDVVDGGGGGGFGDVVVLYVAPADARGEKVRDEFRRAPKGTGVRVRDRSVPRLVSARQREFARVRDERVHQVSANAGANQPRVGG